MSILPGSGPLGSGPTGPGSGFFVMVWGALPDTKLNILQKYQNRAFHLIESLEVMDS